MGNYIQLEEERDGRGGARARGCGRGATCVVGTECCGCTTTICTTTTRSFGKDSCTM